MNAIQNSSAEQDALTLETGHATAVIGWPILPMVVRLKKGSGPSIWLPVFVLWPLIIAAFCLALPLCLVWPAPRGSALAALAATYQVLCALHGTQVELSGADGDWSFSLY